MKGYSTVARAAIEEMAREVGTEVLAGPDGVAQRGLIVRHLVLPNDLAGSEASLRWLGERFGPELHLSIMGQYFPTHRAEGSASRFPLHTRSMRASEYQVVLSLLEDLCFENGWVQDLESAPEYYLPDFDDAQVPFRDLTDFQPSPQISNQTDRMAPTGSNPSF